MKPTTNPALFWRGLAFLLAAALLIPAGGAAAAPLAAEPLYTLLGAWSWPTGMGLNNQLFDVVLDGSGNLYVAGEFTDGGDGAGGNDDDCDFICKWNGSAWSWPSDPAWEAGTTIITSLALDGSGNLYVSGNFLDGGGDLDCDGLCKWDGSTWSWPDGKALGFSSVGLLWDGSSLYVYGGIGAVGGDLDCNNICLWDGSNWSWPSSMGLNSSVYDLVQSSGNLYASGLFSDAGGDTDCDWVAIWTGSAWDCPAGFGLSGSVNSVGQLARDSAGNLYAGGDFFNAAGDFDCDRICMWNGASWSWPDSKGLDNTVFTVRLDASDNLYVSGNFTNGGDGAGGDDDDCDYLCYWNGSTWEWPGVGATGWANDLVQDGSGNWYMGGSFLNMGADADCDWICLFTPTIALFGDDFESGDFSAWSSVNTGSGNLTVEMGCAMEGTYGMCAVSTNNKRKQVTDSVPDDETRYYASFLLDHNDVTISGSANRIRIFQGRMDTHFPFIVLLRYSGGNRQVMLRLQTDAGPGNYVDSAWYTVSDGVHTIGVDWSQSSGANDGWGDLYVDGTLQGTGHTVDLVDNDTLVIRGTRLGITTRMDGVTMTGTLYFDDFYSDNDGYPE